MTNQELDFSGRKLAALIDNSVDGETRQWIESLAEETLIRMAAISGPVNDLNLKNFANHLLTGAVDVVVFLTAAGVTQFFQRASRLVAADRLIDSLLDIQTVAAGEFVGSKLTRCGVSPTYCVADYTGWRDLLIRLERDFPLDNMAVGLEKTAEVHGLTAGLEARGCKVTTIDAIRFRQSDPSDSEQDLLDSIEDGNLAGLLFPNPVCAARFTHLIGQRDQPVLQKNAHALVMVALDMETEQLLADRGLRSHLLRRA